MFGKKLASCGVLLLVAVGLMAQHDTSLQAFRIQEILISDEESSDANDAFNFYRSSKIDQTEEILSRIEGVNLVRRGAFGMEPILRVYSAGQINLTINGMKMYGACTDRMDPVSSYVEPGNLGKLETSQGATGLLNSSTIGGQLNMQLKEPDFDCHRTIHARFYSQYQTANEGRHAGMELKTGNPKWGLRMYAGTRKAGDYRAGGGQIIKHSGYEKSNLQFGLARKLTSHQSMIGEVLIDRAGNMGYPALTMDVQFAHASIFSILHRFILSTGWLRKLETRLYFNRIDHAMDDQNRPETPMHMDMPGWSRTTGFYSEMKVHFRHQELELRADAHRAFTRADMTMYPPAGRAMYMQTLVGNEYSNAGISLIHHFHLPFGFTLAYHARVDLNRQEAVDTFGILQWSGFGTDLNQPKHTVLKNAGTFLVNRTKKLMCRLSLSYGERLPTANETFGFYLFNRLDGYDYLGNFTLKPEKALQAEWQFSRMFPNAEVGITLFYHAISDFIYSEVREGFSPMTIGGRGVKGYNNISYARVSGGECRFQTVLRKHWKYTGNARFTFARLSNHLPMAQVPPLKSQHNIRYQKGIWQLQGEYLFAAKQNRINSDFGEQVTPAWQTLNLRAAWSHKTGKHILQLHLAIENLTDARYREHLDWGGIPRMGFNVQTGINVYIGG